MTPRTVNVPGESSRATDLLLAVAQGDSSAFDALYRLCQPMVVATTRALVRNPAIAEEVVQEVWLQVWRSADRYDPSRGTAEAWLRVLAKHRAIDRVRAERHSSERELRWGTSESTHRRDEIAEHIERRTKRAALLRGLSQLTHHQREAIALAYLEDQTYPQIAERLRISQGAAKTRGYDALVRLRRLPDLAAWQA
ncbi:MAG: sigma-70 family RNA polymerase sigma factor [Sporichthyaceae bacterium]